MALRTRLSASCTALGCEATYSSTDLKSVLATGSGNDWSKTLHLHRFARTLVLLFGKSFGQLLCECQVHILNGFINLCLLLGPHRDAADSGVPERKPHPLRATGAGGERALPHKLHADDPH